LEREQRREREERERPLTTGSIGGEEGRKRAEILITVLSEVGGPECSVDTNSGYTLLPSKEQILLGIECLDNGIKTSERGLERRRGEERRWRKRKRKREKREEKNHKHGSEEGNAVELASEEDDTSSGPDDPLTQPTITGGLIGTLEHPSGLLNLITTITTQNKSKASVSEFASLNPLPILNTEEIGELERKMAKGEGRRTGKEWGYESRFVSGPSDALYQEPCSNPNFTYTQQQYHSKRRFVAGVISVNNRRLRERWEELGEEYVDGNNHYQVEKVEIETRRREQERLEELVAEKNKSVSGLNTPSGGGGSSWGRRSSGGSGGGRRSSSGFGAANAGDFIASEYEQEKIIASLVAEEKMEKRIKFGVCRYVGRSARERGVRTR